MKLAEYLERQQGPSPRAWVEHHLPAEVQAEILAHRGTVSVPKVVAWLRSEGYEGVSAAKLRNWLERVGVERVGE